MSLSEKDSRKKIIQMQLLSANKGPGKGRVELRKNKNDGQKELERQDGGPSFEREQQIEKRTVSTRVLGN